MKRIIKDINKLAVEAEAIQLKNDTGRDAEAEEKCASIINELKTILSKKPNIKALAAPQIGLNARIFCIRFNDTIKTFINPVITKKSGASVVLETCESMPNMEIVIHRPAEITTVYYTDEFKYEENKLLGAGAALFDQMNNLLDGIIPTDLGLAFNVDEVGHLTQEDLPELIPMLNTYVKTKLAAIEKSIEEDDSTNSEYKLAKFTENVINGRTKVVESDAEFEARQEAAKIANKSQAQFNKAQQVMQKVQYREHINKVTKHNRHRGKR